MLFFSLNVWMIFEKKTEKERWFGNLQLSVVSSEWDFYTFPLLIMANKFQSLFVEE
jgi:hypothetical protein